MRCLMESSGSTACLLQSRAAERGTALLYRQGVMGCAAAESMCTAIGMVGVGSSRRSRTVCSVPAALSRYCWLTVLV